MGAFLSELPHSWPLFGAFFVPLRHTRTTPAIDPLRTCFSRFAGPFFLTKQPAPGGANRKILFHGDLRVYDTPIHKCNTMSKKKRLFSSLSKDRRGNTAVLPIESMVAEEHESQVIMDKG